MTRSILPAPNLTRTERQFQSNREDINIVINYLIDNYFDRVSIPNFNSGGRVRDIEDLEMRIVLNEDVVEILSINDMAVSESILRLFQNSYRTIGKRERMIFLGTWSTRDHGRGIVYFMDGQTPREEFFTFLTELYPLSEENWFFFIENFNDYRRGIRPNLTQ